MDRIQRYLHAAICARAMRGLPYEPAPVEGKEFRPYENNARTSAHLRCGIRYFVASVEMGGGNVMDEKRLFGSTALFPCSGSISTKQVCCKPDTEPFSWGEGSY